MKKICLFLLLVANLSFAQQEFPSVDLKSLESETISTSSFNEQDKLYVFSFWATWCAPCIQELQDINEYYNDWKEELNVEVIAVSVDDSRTQKRVSPMVNGKGWTYNVLLDSNQDLKRALSITNVPFLLVVKNKEIVKIHNGYSEGSVEELYKELKEL